MLRMYLLQILFNLSNRGVEDTIYDSHAMRAFMHLDFTCEQVPDSTPLLKFRHLLEKHNIGEAIFRDIRERLDKNGLIMHGVPLSTRRLSVRLVPSKIAKKRVIRKCTRRKKEINGITE